MTELLRTAIQQAGGLFTQAGLARRWQVSRQAVNEAVKREDFPEEAALLDGDRPAWSGHEADTWRAGRPSPKA